MPTDARPRLDHLPPEVRAKVEAAMTRCRSPEGQAEVEAIRSHYADRPSLGELVARREIDEESITSGNVRYEAGIFLPDTFKSTTFDGRKSFAAKEIVESSVADLKGFEEKDPSLYALLKTAAALKSAREARGLSLADVAERSGIDRSALSRLENGQNVNPKSKPSVATRGHSDLRSSSRSRSQPLCHPIDPAPAQLSESSGAPDALKWHSGRFR